MSKPSHGHRQQKHLLDSEITTVKTNRRSFLTRAVGAGALALGAVSTLGCEKKSDLCDSDIGTDADPSDRAFAGQRDTCDSD